MHITDPGLKNLYFLSKGTSLRNQNFSPRSQSNQFCNRNEMHLLQIQQTGLAFI
jgi:hypothetical protein